MMPERIENRDPLWRQTEKQYFSGEPCKLCFIEADQTLSGSPLWPFDPDFDTKLIQKNLEETKRILNPLKGFVFSKHLVLNSNRELNPNNILWQDHATKLTTTFVSGFLIPRSSLQKTEIGFYPLNGTIPPLKETVKNLKGTWLVSNLGYFITDKLIGLLNQRHEKAEHLDSKNNSYLGGYFVRTEKELIAYPPHFGTCGVGITKEGKPVLIDNVKLAGGSIWIGDQKFSWNKTDVNPQEVGSRPLAVYTPAFITTHPEQKIGGGRVNVVVINEGAGAYPVPKIAYVKQGAFVQPAGAVVFSFAPLPGPPPQGGREVHFEFEPWFDEKIWNDLSSFYEGLMELSIEGQNNFEDWIHPNAVLTQETFIPNPLRREPRNVLIQTENYFGAFAFSGRYEYSIGASFVEIVPALKNILKQLAPKENLRKVFNLDGGSGAKLCLVQEGKVGALNWVAPGMRNRLGDPNGNTYSCLLLNFGA